MPTEKYLNINGLDHFKDKIETHIKDSIIPTIEISVSQVISMDPLQLQLTNEQFSILETNMGKLVTLDATALDPALLRTACVGVTNNLGYFRFELTGSDGTSTSFIVIDIDRETKIAEMYELQNQPELTAGPGIDITDNVISAQGLPKELTAGPGIDITDNVISAQGLPILRIEASQKVDDDIYQLTDDQYYFLRDRFGEIIEIHFYDNQYSYALCVVQFAGKAFEHYDDIYGHVVNISQQPTEIWYNFHIYHVDASTKRLHIIYGDLLVTRDDISKMIDYAIDEAIYRAIGGSY